MGKNSMDNQLEKKKNCGKDGKAHGKSHGKVIQHKVIQHGKVIQHKKNEKRDKKERRGKKETPPIDICPSCGKLIDDCKCMEDFLNLVNLINKELVEATEKDKNKDKDKDKDSKKVPRLTSKDFILNNIDKQIENLDDFINILDHKDANEQQKLLVSNLRELDNLVGMNFIKQQIINQLLFFMQDLIEPGTFLHTVITGSPGVGKCLGYNTDVMMFDGTVKKVQDIKKDDKLMGDDYTVRNVLSTCIGKEKMFLIKQTNGMDYVVNESHILSLRDENFDIVDISVKKYLENLKNNNNKNLLGYKAGGLVSDIEVVQLGEDYYKQGQEYEYYYGFEIDGNRRFLLGDFTVTHNTSLINILAKIYNNIGLLKTNKVLKVDRADLIAEYLGQTAKKTKDVLIKATGGILLIDEAYSLGSGQSGENRDSFAKECIDTLNQYLTEHVDELVCIIAGYEDEIEKCFFKQNSGLHRRFPWRFHIHDYSPEELCEILYRQLGSWKIDCDKKIILEKLKENMKYFSGNGGDTRNLLDKCKVLHARRNFKQIHQSVPVVPVPVVQSIQNIQNIDQVVPRKKKREEKYLNPSLDIVETSFISNPLNPPNPPNTPNPPLDSKNKIISLEDFDTGMKNFILSKKIDTKLCKFCREYSKEIQDQKNCSRCLESSKKSSDMYL
jgi:hypothetical protein